MVLLSIFFTRIRSTEGSSADCSLFIFRMLMRCFFIEEEILLKSSVWRFEHVGLTYICLLYLYQQDCTLLRKLILLSEKYSTFSYKSPTNTRRSDQIETIKMIMQTTRPRITWKVLPMAQVAIFKEIFDQVRKDFRLWIVLFWTKTSQRLTLYLLSSHR